MKNRFKYLGLVLALGVTQARANVALEFRPSSQTVAIGDVVSIEVYAVSQTPGTIGFSAGDFIVTWDLNVLNPISYTNAGAGYAWGNSGFLFPTLNGALNDGDAEWSFERQLFGTVPQATPAGLKLTTLRFTAKAQSPGTLVNMPATLSGRTTRIFDPIIPNTNILKSLAPSVMVFVNLPSTNIEGTLILQDTLFSSSYTRDIIGTVKQGTSTIGSVSVLGINSPSANFSASVSGAYSGPAVIEFDGSSFLRKSVNVVLNNGTMTVGTVSLVNGDIDNSGEVDAADIDAVISAFGNTNDTVEDCDVSGEVDAADIDIVIANFGEINN